MMPGMDGFDFMERVLTLHPQTPIIMMTAYGSMEAAIRAMRLGAFDFITKPFNPEELTGVQENIVFSMPRELRV